MFYVNFFSFFALLFLFYFSIRPLKKLLFFYRWKKISNLDFPKNYSEILEKSLFPYSRLNEKEKRKLEKKIQYFLYFKKISPLQNFKITEEMKLLIAAQACLLVINIDGDIFPGLTNIYVSAGPFIENENYIDVNTMMPKYVARLGESWKGGPVVLSWSSVKQDTQNWFDGHNVVLHEFAHQLDAQDGGMDGTPPLERALLDKWSFFMGRDFRDLRKRISHHQKNDINEYGATNAAEFFAVTVEQFFERPLQLKRNHPEIFKLYEGYFHFDPSKLFT